MERKKDQGGDGEAHGQERQRVGSTLVRELAEDREGSERGPRRDRETDAGELVAPVMC
jgi:hypothetical protein